MTFSVEVLITNLVYGGDGMGRLPDGRAVFVPFVLPGETVTIKIVEEKRGHARAELVDVLVPSAERITPKCRHYMVCGGCHYQHIAYPRQLEIKRAVLKEQLDRIGRIKDAPVDAVIPSPEAWGYRNHIQFHLSPQGQLGYLGAGSDVVVPVSECHLPDVLINDLWPRLSFEPDINLDRVSLRSGIEDDAMLVLEGLDPLPPPFEVDFPISAVYQGPEGAVVLSGEQTIEMVVKERVFEVSYGSFFQVNSYQVEAMVDELLANLPLSAEMTVLEVYCGVGLFSAFLAPRVKQLVGIDLSEDACEDFSVNLEDADNVSLYIGSAEEILPSLDLKPEIILVDPPRSGMERQALEAVLEMHPQHLVYVSCDPATLARDTRRLVEGGYTLTKVTPIDMFPQTYHIESISYFTIL